MNLNSPLLSDCSNSSAVGNFGVLSTKFTWGLLSRGDRCALTSFEVEPNTASSSGSGSTLTPNATREGGELPVSGFEDGELPNASRDGVVVVVVVVVGNGNPTPLGGSPVDSFCCFAVSIFTALPLLNPELILLTLVKELELAVEAKLSIRGADFKSALSELDFDLRWLCGSYPGTVTLVTAVSFEKHFSPLKFSQVTSSVFLPVGGRFADRFIGDALRRVTVFLFLGFLGFGSTGGGALP